MDTIFEFAGIASHVTDCVKSHSAHEIFLPIRLKLEAANHLNKMLGFEKRQKDLCSDNIFARPIMIMQLI